MGSLGREAPSHGPGAEPLSDVFFRFVVVKCNFTAAAQAGKERFLCPFEIN